MKTLKIYALYIFAILALASGLWFVLMFVADFLDSTRASFEILDLSSAHVLWLDAVEGTVFILLIVGALIAFKKRKNTRLFLYSLSIFAFIALIVYTESFLRASV